MVLAYLLNKTNRTSARTALGETALGEALLYFRLLIPIPHKLNQSLELGVERVGPGLEEP